jgi:hypothetical protein
MEAEMVVLAGFAGEWSISDDADEGVAAIACR